MLSDRSLARSRARRSIDVQMPQGTRKVILVARRCASYNCDSSPRPQYLPGRLSFGARRHGKITLVENINIRNKRSASVHAYDTQSSAVKGTECLLQIHYTRYNIHDNRIYIPRTVKSRNLLYIRNS